MSTNPIERCHKVFVRLQELKDQYIQQLKSKAFEIAQEHFAYLQQNPSLQAMEVCDKGYKDFKEEVEKEFESSSEADIMRMYLVSEADTSFHSRSFQNEIQTLIVGH